MLTYCVSTLLAKRTDLEDRGALTLAMFFDLLIVAFVAIAVASP